MAPPLLNFGRMRFSPLKHIRPMFVRPCGAEGDNYRFAGTGASLTVSNRVVTAAHVVDHAEADDIGISLLGKNQVLTARQVWRHPTADIAVVEFDTGAPDFLPEPVEFTDETCSLGTGLCSFGYPFTTLDGGALELEPRFLSGYIQRFFTYRGGRYEYTAAEISFPVPTGMSGAPLLAKSGFHVIGLVTATFESSTVIDSIEERISGNATLKHTVSKVVSYGVALLFSPEIKEWIITCGAPPPASAIESPPPTSQA